MKCPKCSRPVVSFGRWGSRERAFRYKCPHCRIALRGSPATTFLHWALLVTFPLCIGLAVMIRDERPVPLDSPLLLVPFVYLTAVLVALLVNWTLGSYRVAPPPVARPRLDELLPGDDGVGPVEELSASALPAFVANRPLAVIHLWAPWNGYDRVFAADLRRLAGHFPSTSFAAMNYDDPKNRPVAERLAGEGILSSPILLWFRDGELEEVCRGTLRAADVERLTFLEVNAAER